MEAHYQISDIDFAEQFADCTFPPQWFSHTAHLRLAWILIKEYGQADARALMCEQIQRFDQTHGDGTKFHHTLTEAAVQVVHHFIGRSTTSDFPDFLAEFPRLVTNFKDLLLSHYSPEVLFTTHAGAQYTAPDLLAFPS